MGTITIDVNIQQLNLLAQKIERIANEQSLALRPIGRKTKTDLSPAHNLQQDIALSYNRKKRDISQAKKLY
jgi:hypothetical protein